MKNPEKKNTFFENPGKALFHFVAATVVIWTVQCSLLQRILPLDVIETITWGGQWQLGQFKHPPLSGWIGYAFSCLSGHADWSMYLAAQLSIACGIWFVYRLAKEFFTDFEAAAAALLLYILHYYTPSSMKFCSHFLEIAFLPAMMYYFYLGVKNDRWKDWILFAVFSALAFLGKYSAAQLFPACLICLLFPKQNRDRFKSFGLYFSGVLFLILIAPHLYWLSQHDFAAIRHVGVRVGDMEDPWYYPFLIIGTILYPFAAETGLLFVSWFFSGRDKRRKPVAEKALYWSLVFTLSSSLIYLVISLAGGHVVLTWFSFLASWTGISVAAFFPFEINQKVFRNLYLLLCLFVFCMLIGTTIDMLNKPRLKLHTRPEAFVTAAQNYWKTHSAEPISVAVGERWAVGVLENYTPGRPQACVLNDPCNLELVRAKIEQHGALLFADQEECFQSFLKEMGRNAEDWQKIQITASAFSGKTRTFSFVFGYLPPVKSDGKQRTAVSGTRNRKEEAETSAF